MSTVAHDEDPTALEPLEFIERAEDTDGAFVRIEVTLHPHDAASSIASGVTHRRWIVDDDGEHRHPTQEEYISVLTGELRVVVDGTDRTLTQGDEIVLPASVPHRHWNPADRPTRVRVEHRPAHRSEQLLETLFTLAQAGKTDESGVPNLLQSMVLQQTYPDHAYAADVPIVVQKALASLLGPIGRLAGYRASYAIEDVETIR